MNARDTAIERAQMRVLFQVPFFAPAVARLPVVWSDEVPTAATDGKRILFNPGFFASLEGEVVMTVLAHEAAHCLLGHLWRMPMGGDPKVWNQAIDHAVNLMLLEFSRQRMAKGLADPFPFPKPKKSYCADPRFSGMNEEQIYRILMAEQGGRKGKQPGQGQGPGKPGPGDFTMPSFGDVLPQDGEAADQKQLKTDWDNAAIQSAKLGEQRGFCPGGLSRLVDELTSTSVPWYALLASWLRELANDDWDLLTPALEYSDCDFILPSLKSDRIGPAVFATDTSGSMDEDANCIIQSEKQAFLDRCRPRKLVDIYCDTKIHKVAEYSPGDTIDLDAPGGGGTSFVPVFERVAQMEVQPKCLVYLTDLDGDFPAEVPSYPVLWVVTGKTKKAAPFGEVVYVEA